VGRKRKKNKRSVPLSPAVPDQTSSQEHPSRKAKTGLAICAILFTLGVGAFWYHQNNSTQPEQEGSSRQSVTAPPKPKPYRSEFTSPPGWKKSPRDIQAEQNINAQISSVAQQISACTHLPRGQATAQVKAMMDGPEERVNLTLAHLLLASELPEFDGMDIAWELAQIDWLAGYVRYLEQQYRPQYQRKPEAFGGCEQEFRIRMLVMALNSPDLLRISYVDGKPNPADPTSFFVNGLMRTRKGTCISMHVIYILLGERLEWPIHGVIVKDHLFCRWDDGEYRSNIEGTAKGAEPKDADYVRDFKLTKQDLESTIFMRNLTKKQMLAQFLFHRSMYWVAVNKVQRATEDLRLAVTVPGRDPYMHNNLANNEGRSVADMHLSALSPYPGKTPTRTSVDPTGFSGPPDPLRDTNSQLQDAMSDPLYYLRHSANPRQMPMQQGGASSVPTPGAPAVNPSAVHPALNDPLYCSRQRPGQ
jgi:hypothetical protein